jgi:hypothetical protein
MRKLCEDQREGVRERKEKRFEAKEKGGASPDAVKRRVGV